MLISKNNRTIISNNFRMKYLTVGKHKSGGRNTLGRITAYHRGGGHKRLMRIVDYSRFIWNVHGIVVRVEYDPNRNALLALVVYSNGLSAFIIATSAMKVGTKIVTADYVPVSEGNAMRLSSIPAGIRISCIEITPNQGAQYVRAAGTYAKIVAKTDKYAVIQLRSGLSRRVLLQCIATIGSISNFSYMFKRFNRAGVSRRLGWRPVVRGVAMNPIDHPHGGGQGKTSGGRPSVTPWGFITKGRKTTTSRTRNFHLIVKAKSKKPKRTAKAKDKIK